MVGVRTESPSDSDLELICSIIELTEVSLKSIVGSALSKILNCPRSTIGSDSSGESSNNLNGLSTSWLTWHTSLFYLVWLTMLKHLFSAFFVGDNLLPSVDEFIEMLSRYIKFFYSGVVFSFSFSCKTILTFLNNCKSYDFLILVGVSYPGHKLLLFLNSISLVISETRTPPFSRNESICILMSLGSNTKLLDRLEISSEAIDPSFKSICFLNFLFTFTGDSSIYKLWIWILIWSNSSGLIYW